MTPEAILSQPPRVLSQAQREAYFRDGFIAVPGLIGRDWLDRLEAVTAEFVERSRRVAAYEHGLDPGPAVRQRLCAAAGDRLLPLGAEVALC
jgi:ectoine hydroxylase